MGEQNCNRFGEWPSKNSTVGKHVVVVIVEIIKIMGWYSWKLNLIMIGIDDRRPQRKTITDYTKFLPYVVCSVQHKHKESRASIVDTFKDEDSEFREDVSMDSLGCFSRFLVVLEPYKKEFVVKVH
nr:hypothetical protein [Tanacetum cinerariifolium]